MQLGSTAFDSQLAKFFSELQWLELWAMNGKRVHIPSQPWCVLGDHGLLVWCQPSQSHRRTGRMNGEKGAVQTTLSSVKEGSGTEGHRFDIPNCH